MPGETASPRIKRASASDQIHAALRARIVSLDLEPGRNLSRQEIAAYYGVSQTPVRDAMLRLEEEGLLVIFPQSKTEVSMIDVEQARETQFLRLSVELEVARRLSERADKTVLATAARVLSLQKATLAENDLERFAQLDRLFHQSLCEAAGVSNLWELIGSRSGHIDRLRNLTLPDPGKPASIIHYHSLILDSIAAGDAPAAEAAVRAHLSGTLSQIEEVKARHPDYFRS
ncbi:GntR family transcriptional regulator [Martelella radicis]|uniref:DNA-binding GntR family transcriptional regulator n=1 Tax=Martelella radicis TaxID=1397476 RepID=A0A7W6KKG8_9HYPH|nr:GntR family transcriptional regulator [Martelella radicis]MBB4121804.1 DNA-binding GntR family transcriptional regulator [Martelella radicis]